MRSWMWMFLGSWLLVAGGCNCIIDADKYRGGGGGGGDAGDIDAADNLPDAGPPDGRIESDAGPIEPTSAREGEGSGMGAPPVMIVLRGDFAAGSTARVVRSDDDTETDLVVEPAVVSGSGNMLAFGIRIPVYDDVDEGETATLEVYVDEGGPEDLVATFTVDGLMEADLSGPVDTTMLRSMYSTITVSGPVAFAGAAPAILRSTTDITVAANLVGDGKQGGAAGPGGCTGGGATQQGECNLSGGAGGASGALAGDGGGGAGHTQIGNPGTGGAPGGEISGNDMLTPLVAESGNGGGGGGNGTAELAAGGPGGGGGGVIDLSAGGAIAIDGLVDVSGGAGMNGGGSALCATAGGSGGGGSGGAILVRAMLITGAGSLDATRGLGAQACNDGGNGSPGRIRIDVASEDLPGLTVNPAPVRGPHWVEDTPHLVREAGFTAQLYGEPNRTYAANVDGSDPDDVETNGSGVGSYTITLEAGHNRICTVVSPTAQITLPEAVRCMVVTYVPE